MHKAHLVEDLVFVASRYTWPAGPVPQCAELAQVAGDRFRLLRGPGFDERFGELPIVAVWSAGRGSELLASRNDN
jgi:hypothetical protein